MTTTASRPLVVAVDDHLVIDLTPCCPWCFDAQAAREPQP